MYKLTKEQELYFINSIELDLTTFCNKGCRDCSRGCDKFPDDKILTREKVREFVFDSIKLNKRWIKIGLLGGEPTLHPDIYNIISELCNYVCFNSHVDIWMMTNGTHPEILYYINLHFPFVRIVINTDQEKHHAFYVSPTDEGLFQTNDFCEGLLCGTGLGPSGYTPCVLGTFLTRIFNYRTIKELKDLSFEACQKLFEVYCQHCGWYLVDSHNRNYGKIYNYPPGYMTPTWYEKYEKYEKYEG